MKLFSTLVFITLLAISNLHNVICRHIVEHDVNRHNNLLNPLGHKGHKGLEGEDLALAKHMSEVEKICLLIFKNHLIKSLCNSDVLSKMFNNEHLGDHEIHLDEYEDVVKTFHSDIDMDNNVLDTPVDPHTKKEALLNVYESLCVNGLALSCYKVLE